MINAITDHLWRESRAGSYVAAAACAEQMRRDLRGLSSLIGHTPTNSPSGRAPAPACGPR